MKKFHTGYYLTFKSGRFTAREYSDAMITQSEYKLTPKNYQGINWEITWKYNSEWKGLEFILLTETFEIAQNVLFNILCASCVVDGTQYWSNESHYPHELGTIQDFKSVDTINKPIRGLANNEIPEYFSLAAKASHDIRIQNSIIKYQLSNDMYSQHYMDLHEVIEWKTTDYNYIQMKFAYAIILAYSVVEELGLEIKASTNNPSILSNNEWNPKVLNNLISRLENYNINVNEHITWFVRGKETENEIKKLRISKKTEWADPTGYENAFFISIKDGYVYLPDAINYISYLRSSIASHCVGERIMGLSVFDVANAQFLARRLILEKMNMWK